MTQNFKIFVYGSLKKGFHNHDLLNGAKFLGHYVTRNDYYVMTGKGHGFPFVYKMPNHWQAGYISGELYEVSAEQLEDLDILEGHPLFYKRTLISLQDYPDKVFMYVTVEVLDRPIVPPINKIYKWEQS